MVVIDISDAFMSLGVAQKEIPHTLAPHTNKEGYYAFIALLFGYKTAPLLWSRVAALHARLMQSLVAGHEGQHQVYLDDALWFLQGDLATRNLILSMLLHTSAALGLKVSLRKGERSTQVTWIGVRLTLTEDYLIMGLPDKYTSELVSMLRAWDSRGMAPIKELRQVAGKAAWLSGILPRARWTVSIFYRVLHARLADIRTGAEDRRRADRKDNRDKSNLFHVKQLDQARQWLITYLQSAMEVPVKKFRLDSRKYPSAAIITDACPEGLGATLLINNRIIRAYASTVTTEDADMLKFELGSSASQGIVETLAVLVAIKHWSKELRSCNLTLHVQSDSLVALAMTQKLSNSNPALNFFGAELAITCEVAGVEHLKATHIPGAANTTADWLSRPSKQRADNTPAELEGIPIQQPAKRGAGYYSLPTPGESPQLWASQSAAESAWATLR
eukprot:s2172_g16.t1